ncbi:hypothetical protein [Janthinobacterium sp.]|uniref:hypothetical protein n=1 Tax=Janthinobacterium sp. TaxID=1871054 RepID=UPI0026099306|nr:hypothetical protein [Janthinobacterium sp.]
MMDFLKKVFCEILLQNDWEEALLLSAIQEIIEFSAVFLDKNAKPCLDAFLPYRQHNAGKMQGKRRRNGSCRTICSEITFF